LTIVLTIGMRARLTISAHAHNGPRCAHEPVRQAHQEWCGLRDSWTGCAREPVLQAGQAESRRHQCATGEIVGIVPTLVVGVGPA
jgi:hypothetical protein